MEKLNVVGFKLCNIFMFKGLIEQITLRHKIDSQQGTKTNKLLLSLQIEVFTKHNKVAQKKLCPRRRDYHTQRWGHCT